MPDLTTRQVADRLLITEQSVRFKIRQGELPASRTELGSWRISPAELARYIEAQKTRPHGMTRFWEKVRELRRAAELAA